MPFAFTGKLDELTLVVDRPRLTRADAKRLQEEAHRNERASE